MGIFLFWAGWTPKVKISLRSRLLYRWRPGGGGKLRLLSNAFVKELGISFLFLFPRDTMTVCLYVCLFFFVRAGRFKRPLGGDQGGIPITFCFFAYRSFIIFGIRSFWFAHHGSRERSLLFYYDGKLCKFSFSFSFRRYCLIIQICFLIYVFCFFATNKNGEEE